ncbi:AbrB/MazE/SpoVT family DNA-binding domain-containing protein [bacterium]|nr:AbrB/MazE/SpoVT family DNA-binding domain-containing protein [bacterium]
MLRKIFKTGNSMVVSLPKEAIEFLQIDEGSEVKIEVDRENHQIIILPANPPGIEGVDQEFARQVAEFIEQYRPALEELAK